jgi:hypothetical protein
MWFSALAAVKTRLAARNELLVGVHPLGEEGAA